MVNAGGDACACTHPHFYTCASQKEGVFCDARAGHNDSACKGPGNFFIDYYPNFEGFLCLFTLPKFFATINIILIKILQIS